MGLYERLLEERAEEERRRAVAVNEGFRFEGPGQAAGGAPEDRPPGYSAGLATMRRHLPYSICLFSRRPVPSTAVLLPSRGSDSG